VAVANLEANLRSRIGRRDAQGRLGGDWLGADRQRGGQEY